MATISACAVGSCCWFHEIASARQHLAVAHDHRTERIGIIAKRRLLEGDAHEAFVVSGRGRLDASANAGVTIGSADRAERPVTRCRRVRPRGRRFGASCMASLHCMGGAWPRVARSPERDEVSAAARCYSRAVLLPSSEGARHHVV